jgi:hypothetical protein
MRGWETKYEWEGTGRGAGNEFRVEGSIGMRQRTVRSVSSLELLVSMKPSVEKFNTLQYTTLL